MAAWFTFIIAFSTTILTQVFGSGVFELDLHEFTNSKGFLANGNSCRLNCRTFFRVCLKNYQAVVSPGDCIFGSAVTPVLGTNSFSVKNGGTFSRPIRLPFNFGWPGSFSMIIEAWYSPSADLPVGKSIYSTPQEGTLYARFTNRSPLTSAPFNKHLKRSNLINNQYLVTIIDSLPPNNLNFCTHHRPCVNGATCMNTGQGSFTCTCPPGFTGLNCELELQECDSNPCRYGGLCTNLDVGYRCSCPQGFEGSNCEHSLLTCADSPCFHSGQCHQKDNGRSYTCECPPGYTGLNCEKRVDKCTSLPCANGGLCLIHGGVRLCSCRSGFTGQRCEININECAGNPCTNGGTCLDRINDYTCACPPGYAGRNCDRVLDECSMHPCLNKGLCTREGGLGKSQTTCICPTDFTGPRCQFVAVTLPVGGERINGESQDGFQWAAVSLAVGLVAFLVLLCMVGLALRHIHRQMGRDRGDRETMNNLSDVQKDNLIPASQLKNTNQKVLLEVDCESEKSNFIHKNYHLDYSNAKSKEFKDDKSQEDKRLNHIYDKCLEEKIPMSGMYSEKEECRISTICSPRDSQIYQSVFVIGEEKRECVIATEVRQEKYNSNKKCTYLKYFMSLL
uniref:Delta-like 4 (Drosophila) n=1 Tax=Salmo trutta TaxID=8032 RepID=A0A673XJ61_SALTR